MDNAADAIKMAGSVMIFVMALSIVIFAFSQARESSDIILNYRDRETMYIDGDYYYASSETKKTRQVGIADVIPTVERAYLENYVVVFLGLDKPIYTIITPATNTTSSKKVEKYSVDLSSDGYKPGLDERKINMILGTPAIKKIFLEYILYGADESTIDNFNNHINPNSLKLAGNNGSGSKIIGINEQLKSKTKITEYLGVYYEDEDSSTFVPEAQKIEKRIVTYICEN